MSLISMPTELSKVVGRYHKELQDYVRQGTTELNLCPAFQSLLAEMTSQMSPTLNALCRTSKGC